MSGNWDDTGHLILFIILNANFWNIEEFLFILKMFTFYALLDSENEVVVVDNPVIRPRSRQPSVAKSLEKASILENPVAGSVKDDVCVRSIFDMLT